MVLRIGGLLPAGLPTDLPGLDVFPPGLPPLRLALLLDCDAPRLPADLAAFTLTPPCLVGVLLEGLLFLEAAVLLGRPVSLAKII